MSRYIRRNGKRPSSNLQKRRHWTHEHMDAVIGDLIKKVIVALFLALALGAWMLASNGAGFEIKVGGVVAKGSVLQNRP